MSEVRWKNFRNREQLHLRAIAGRPKALQIQAKQNNSWPGDPKRAGAETPRDRQDRSPRRLHLKTRTPILRLVETGGLESRFRISGENDRRHPVQADELAWHRRGLPLLQRIGCAEMTSCFTRARHKTKSQTRAEENCHCPSACASLLHTWIGHGLLFPDSRAVRRGFDKTATTQDSTVCRPAKLQ